MIDIDEMFAITTARLEAARKLLLPHSKAEFLLRQCERLSETWDVAPTGFYGQFESLNCLIGLARADYRSFDEFRINILKLKAESEPERKARKREYMREFMKVKRAREKQAAEERAARGE